MKNKQFGLKKKLRRMYDTLDAHFGDLGWWPADSDFEVIVGAVLTQNTAWGNVEKAIASLKREKMMDPLKIHNATNERLSRLIRASGFHRLKASRLKEITGFLLERWGGKLESARKEGIARLREELLLVKGIGPETADSILLYAFDKPVFVVDAYTKRIFERHRLIGNKVSYNDVQCFVHESFPWSVRELNQFHALIVETAKRFCKKGHGLCDKCPLNVMLKRTGR